MLVFRKLQAKYRTRIKNQHQSRISSLSPFFVCAVQVKRIFFPAQADCGETRNPENSKLLCCMKTTTSEFFPSKSPPAPRALFSWLSDNCSFAPCHICSESCYLFIYLFLLLSPLRHSIHYVIILYARFEILSATSVVIHTSTTTRLRWAIPHILHTNVLILYIDV